MQTSLDYPPMQGPYYEPRYTSRVAAIEAPTSAESSWQCQQSSPTISQQSPQPTMNTTTVYYIP